MSRLCTALTTAGLLLAALSGAAAQVRDRPRIASDTPLGTIAGLVDIEIDHQRVPIRRARVTLSAEANGKQSTTTTDTDGRYRFERIAAGTYRVRAEKLGFVSIPLNPDRPSDPPAPVQIKAGDTAAVDITMQRGAALEGQFLDDRGHAIARLTVYADRLVGTAARGAVGDTRSTTTDDLGRFRLHTLWPGRYYLHATLPAPGTELYYPGAPSARQATTLTLVAGQTLDRLDFMVATPPLSTIAAEALVARESETMSSAAPETSGARVAGRLTRIDTGEPIADATVGLLSTRGGAIATARTSADGQFEFTGVPAGSYTLRATADGYLSADGIAIYNPAAGRAIDVKEGERIDKADLTLAPPGAIEGRVLDEFGDPAPGMSVLLTQLVRTIQMRPSVFVPDRGETSSGFTDDRGWFRTYGLRPGDYYLLALPPSLNVVRELWGGSPPPEAADDSGAGFATTFFPGTASTDAAMPVHVAAGADVRDVTFGLIGARTVTMVGVVTDLAGQPASDAMVVLIQTHGGEVRTMVGSTTKAGKNGSFHFPAVPEGSYVLQGFGTGSFGTLPVIVAATSTPAPLVVALTLRPLTTARGHVSFDGEAAPPRDPASVIIPFVPTDMTSGPVGSNAIQAHISQAWDFEIPNLAWKGLIMPIAPPGWSLKSVLLNGRDITFVPYDFQSSDVNGIEIVFTSRLGTVAGTVLDAGRPVANAIVVVFGVDESTWTTPSRFIVGARSNTQGTFSIPGVLPGRYLAVAVPESSVRPTDAAWLAALRPFATAIEVSEGVRTTLTLTMIKR